ncbi:MAG: hypothetical protein U1E16_04745 [Hyphomicrobiales bacterium]
MRDVHEVAAETAAEIVSELTGAAVSKDQAAKAIAGLKELRRRNDAVRRKHSSPWWR